MGSTIPMSPKTFIDLLIAYNNPQGTPIDDAPPPPTPEPPPATDYSDLLPFVNDALSKLEMATAACERLKRMIGNG